MRRVGWFIPAYAGETQTRGRLTLARKPSGISNKEWVLRIHLLPALGGKRQDSITNADIQRLKESLARLQPKTVNNVLTWLSRLLKVALEWGVIDSMPCTIRLLKIAGGRTKFWDFDEYDRLVAAAASLGSDFLVPVLLGGDAGLRAGEIRALEWTDVDLPTGKLFVASSEWRGQIGTTKGNRIRVVPMTTRLRSALSSHRHLRGKRVLCGPEGNPIHANGLASLIERAVRAAGLATGRKPNGAGPHVLRHTFCSHLAMKGAPARATQELAGHCDLATTQRYMHLSPSSLEAAVALLEKPMANADRGAGGQTLPLAIAN